MTMREGCLVVVVGPSGAGKDTVMQAAEERLAGEPNLVFFQRVITRAIEAGGEAHKGVDPLAFEEMAAAGRFAVHWHAHGLSYGIPVETLEAVDGGSVVVVNGSRAAIPLFRAAFARLIIVNVTAHPDALRARLLARGRESAEEIEARLARAEAHAVSGGNVVTIDNSGPLEAAVSRFTTLLNSELGHRAAAE